MGMWLLWGKLCSDRLYVVGKFDYNGKRYLFSNFTVTDKDQREICGERKGEKEIMSEITEQNQDRLIIVIPAYNEEENIENVVAQWHPIVEKT